jgi:hypothetical protein
MLLSSSNFVKNPIKKYLYDCTNKYIQSIILNKDREKEKEKYKKSPVICELNYMNCEHKLKEQDIIFFKEKFSNFFDNYKIGLEKMAKKKPDFLHFYLYFLSTSFFFLLDSSSSYSLLYFLKK